MNEEIVEKVIQILENMQSNLEACGKYRFSEETKRLISEVAEYIRTESAEYLYHHMITKIAKAPSSLHSFGAVIIMMPAIDDAIKGGRVDDN